MSNKEQIKAGDFKRQNISSGGAYEDIYGYSRAVRIGKDIHVSGTCAPAGYESKSAYEQAIAVFSIIEKALEKLDATFSDVIRTVVYIVDMADAEEVSRAHLEIFGSIRPASTLVEITSTLRRWQRVEVETYAVMQ